MRLGRDEREPLKLVHIFFCRRFYQIEEDLRSLGHFFDADPFVPVLRASLPSLVLLYTGLKVAGMREESHHRSSLDIGIRIRFPPATPTSTAVEVMVTMQSFSYLVLSSCICHAPRHEFVFRVESKFSKLFSLEALVCTQFLYQVRQNYPACAHAEYLRFVGRRKMPLDIKQLTIQPCGRFWHPNCIGNGRRMILAPSVFRHALRQRRPAKRPTACFVFR